MSNPKTLPKGRFERVAQLARLGAGTGIGLVTGRNTEKLAEQAVTILGSLRGLAAKVGQMASTLEGVLPESIEAPFANTLARLRDHTETSSFEAISAVIQADLDQSLTKLFRNIDPIPMASASIGQVHRAVLHDGRPVAVKVQHPGIEQAMGSDLSNARLIERLVGTLVPRGFSVDRVFDEVSARLREELDYRIEAENQTRMALLHKDATQVIIPRVILTHSARRVITTELHEGRTLEQVLTSATPAERQGFAATLWRFVFGSILVGGEFNADPHPGNYLFKTAPQIVCLDFGCVQRLSESRRQAARDVHRAAIARDEAAFAQAVTRLLGTRGGAYEAFAVSFSRKAFEPLFASPYRVTPGHLRHLFTLAKEWKTDMLRARPTAVPFPPELALLNRLQFGFYSILSRLDVEVDYAEIDREILHLG